MACLLSACTFDPAGVTSADAPEVDAGSLGDASPPGDGGPCDSDVAVALTIGGIAVQPPAGEPYVHALPGDIVELSAAGSCGRLGPLDYQWQISPIDDTRSTASPDLSSPTLTIYPTDVRDYVVTLTVRSGSASAQATALAIRTHGWQRQDGLPDDQEIRDLSLGGDRLWLAHRSGIHYRPLTTDGAAGFVDLAAEIEGEALPEAVEVAHYSAAARALFLAEAAPSAEFVRVALDGPRPMAQAIAIDGPTVFGQPVRIHDIGAANAGVALATDRGLVRYRGDGFGPVFVPDTLEVHATAHGVGARWAGGHRLHDLRNAGAAFDPFAGAAGGDNRIRALLLDQEQDELWAVTDGFGAARVDIATEATTIDLYDATSSLRADRLRALVSESPGPHGGDVWVATDRGVARYLRARDQWLLLGNQHGLHERLDVQALVLDSSGGRRTLYAGSTRGLVRLQMPTQP